MWRISQRLTRYEETRRELAFRIKWLFRQNFLLSNPISQTDDEVQGNLFRQYEQKFAELLEQQKLTKLCSNAGFSTNIEKGQRFITHDDDALDDMKGSCREYTSK